MTPLQESIEYVQDLVDGMDEEGLDRENNRRHYQALIDAAKKTDVLVKALEKIISINRQWKLDETGNPNEAESLECVKVCRAALQQFHRGE